MLQPIQPQLASLRRCLQTSLFAILCVANLSLLAYMWTIARDVGPYGTTNRVPKYLSAASIGDSNLADNGASGFDFMTHQLHNVVDPTAAQDAATQAYVLAHGGMAIGGTVTSGTPGSVLFVGTGPVLAQDNPDFFWDNSNKRFGVNATNTPPYVLDFRGSLGASLESNINTNATGNSAIDFYNESVTHEGSIGFANSASATASFVRNFLYHFSTGPDWVWANSTGNMVRMGMTAGATFVEIANGASAGASASAAGRFRYNNSTHLMEESLNAGPYVPIITGSAVGSPTFGACGTGPSATVPNGHAADGEQYSIVTIGTGGPTSCAVVFAFSFAGTPACTITPYSAIASAYISAISTNGFTFTSVGGGDLSSDRFVYHCNP
jgi:hypothetical protein